MVPRNTKRDLTPPASALTLLCIAIAASLATVAWINGLPTANLYGESLQVTNYRWGPNCAYVDATLCNNGTQNVLLKSVKANSQPAATVYIAGSNQIYPGEVAVIRVATAFIAGSSCQVAFQTVKGTKVVYTATTESVSSICKMDGGAVTEHTQER